MRTSLRPRSTNRLDPLDRSRDANEPRVFFRDGDERLDVTVVERTLDSLMKIAWCHASGRSTTDVEGVVVFIGGGFILIDVLVDTVDAALDPRVRDVRA